MAATLFPLGINRIHYGNVVNQPDFMGWNFLGSWVNLGMSILLLVAMSGNIRYMYIPT